MDETSCGPLTTINWKSVWKVSIRPCVLDLQPSWLRHFDPLYYRHSARRVQNRKPPFGNPVYFEINLP